MKFQDFQNFREWDLKVFEISNVSDKVKKGLKIEKLSEPLIGILYIDHQCGTTLRILGNGSKLIDDTMLIVRADAFEDMLFTEISDSNYKNEVEKITDVYYKDKKINELRNIKELDEFRHNTFIDDVSAILPVKDIGNEQMWCRLILKTNQKNLYVGELLNSSDYMKEYQAGKYVGIIDYKQDNIHVLIINGLVKFKED